MMKFALWILPIFFGLGAAVSFAQGDTVTITAKDLIKNKLPVGNLTYVVFTRKTKDSPATSLTFVEIKVERMTYKDRSAVAITQRWDSDGATVHKAYTVLDARDFSTLLHDTYWKRLGYTSHFDFLTRKVSFEGPVPSESRDTTEKDFSNSFKDYNLNWQSGQEPKKLRPGDRCPVSTGTHPAGLSKSSVFCADCLWFGTRPAYFAWAFQLGNGDQAVFELTAVRYDRSGYSAKTPWVASPGFSGGITISGHQLDGNSMLRFSVDGAKAQKKLTLTAPNRAVAAGNWSFWPADMVIPRAGCYALRIETSGRVEYVVFNAIKSTH